MKTLILTLMAFFFASFSAFAACSNCPGSLPQQTSSNCYYIHTSSNSHIAYCSSCNSQVSVLPSGLCKMYVMDKGIPITCNYPGCSCCPGGYTPPVTGCSHPCSGKGWVCPVCSQTFCSTHDNHVYYNDSCPSGVAHKTCGTSPLLKPFTTSTCSTCGTSVCSLCGHICTSIVCSHPCSGKGFVCSVCRQTFCSAHDNHVTSTSSCPSGVSHSNCGTPPVTAFSQITCPDCNQSYCSVCGHGSKVKCPICGYWYCGSSCPTSHDECTICFETIVDPSKHGLTCSDCGKKYCGINHVCTCGNPCPDSGYECPGCGKIICRKHNDHEYTFYYCVNGTKHEGCGQHPIAVRQSTATCKAGHEFCTFCGHTCDIDPHEPQGENTDGDLTGVVDGLSKVIANQQTANTKLGDVNQALSNFGEYFDNSLQNQTRIDNNLTYLADQVPIKLDTVTQKLAFIDSGVDDIRSYMPDFKDSFDLINENLYGVDSKLEDLQLGIADINRSLDTSNDSLNSVSSDVNSIDSRLQNIDDNLSNLNDFLTTDYGGLIPPSPVDIVDRSEWSESIDEITRKLVPDFSLSSSDSSDLSFRVPLDLTSFCGRDFSFTIGGWSSLADGKFMWMASICKSISIFVFSLIFVRSVINALRQW